MNDITDLRINELQDPRFMRPLQMDYVQNGHKRKWEFCRVHNNVSVLVHNTTRNVLVFVTQFRPPIYFSPLPNEVKDTRNVPIDTGKFPTKSGFTVEACAGIVDKPLPPIEIAREEILEECGYDIPLANIRHVKTVRGSVGMTGETQTLFFATVTDQMKVSCGGGVAGEGEDIEVIEMTPEQLGRFIDQDVLPSGVGLLYLCTLFLNGCFDNNVKSKS